MAEPKKNEMSDLLNLSRETFLNTMEMLANSNKQFETFISTFFKKGTHAQEMLGKSMRDYIDFLQVMIQDYTNSFNYFAGQSDEYMEKLGDYPYKKELGGLMKRLTDETKQILSYFKVYKIG